MLQSRFGCTELIHNPLYKVLQAFYAHSVLALDLGRVHRHEPLFRMLHGWHICPMPPTWLGQLISILLVTGIYKGYLVLLRTDLLHDGQDRHCLMECSSPPDCLERRRAAQFG